LKQLRSKLIQAGSVADDVFEAPVPRQQPLIWHLPERDRQIDDSTLDDCERHNGRKLSPQPAVLLGIPIIFRNIVAPATGPHGSSRVKGVDIGLSQRGAVDALY
jgi:hypothetical protein